MKTVDSREKPGFRYRRKGCPCCKTRFTTYELMVSDGAELLLPPELKRELMPVFLKLCSAEVEKNLSAKLAKLLGGIALAETSTRSGR